MKNEIIKVQQLPVITQQLQLIKADVTDRVNHALSLVCTEDTVKSVKDARALLNKEFKEWEDKRKEVKKAVLRPYEAFEATYKDCITDVYKTADRDLKCKIDSVESELKESKQKEVVDYFLEYRDSKGRDLSEFVTFLDANINVTLSASLKSLKEQAKAFVDRVCDDLGLIDTQEHKEEILYEYKQNLNVSSAITTVVNRYKAIDVAKKKEAEKTAEHPKKEVEQPVITPPKEVEPILTVRFTVQATRTELKVLKEFLERNGYSYE